MDEKLDALYKNISGEYDLPDLNTFKADMADPEKLSRLHSTLVRDNWEVPDLQTFERDMFPEKKKGTPIQKQGSGVLLPVSQPQSKTASVGTPKITIEGSTEEIPFGETPAPNVILGSSDSFVSPAADGQRQPVSKTSAPNLSSAGSILQANKGKQWVDRVLNPAKYPSIKGKNGEYMTHRLSYAEQDGKFYVYPEIQYDPKTGKLNDYTDREKYGWTALKKARETGEAIEFKTEKEAADFTQNYKKGTPLEKMYSGEVKSPVGINTTKLAVTGDGEQTQGEITQSVAEQAKESKRSKLIANTSMALKNLAEATGGDYNTWEKQIGGILNDPKIKSQDERDYKAMQAAYKIFEESGQSRNSSALPDIGLGNVVVNEALRYTDRSVEMEELWNEKAKVAADFRANDPVGWNDMLQQDKESKYSEIYGVPKGQKPGVNSPAAILADKQLVNSAFERGITGIEDETELKEANLRNQAIFFDRSVKAMEAMGIDPTPAKEQAAQFWKDAGKVRATRHAELQGRIAEVQKMLEGNIPEFQRKAAKAQLEMMQAEDRGFIDPTVKLEKVVAQYATDVKENMEAGDTPYEGLLKYYGNLLFEEKELAAQIGDESTVDEVLRNVGGMTFRGWNDDEMRLKALRDKIRSISPVVLLNEMPKKSGDGGILTRVNLAHQLGLVDMKPVEDSFLGTIMGQGGTIMGEMDTPSAEAKAMDVAEMLTATGLDAEAFISQPYQEKFKEMEEGPGWFSLTHGKELAGMLAGMGLQAYTGGAILKGTGVGQLGTRMEGLLTMLGQTKKAKAAKVMLDAMTRGAGYEITGDLFKNQEHFFNFTTGMVGGLGEQGVHALGKGVAKWLGKTVTMAFGNQSNQAAKFIAAWNSRNDAMKQWIVDPQTGRTVADVMADRSLSKFLSKGIGGVSGQMAEGSIRQLQEVGGSSDVGGALTGLVSIFRDSDVWKQYRDGIKNQFGGDFDERTSFFLDMFFMGAVMGGAHDKGIGREAMKEAQRIHAEMTTEQRAQVDPILDSFGQLAKMQGEVEARQRNVETAPEKKVEAKAPEAAREDAQLRSELEIEGKDLKAELDPTTKGPEVVEVSPAVEPVVEPVAETEVVAEPVVETKPTREEMTTPLEENIGATVDYEGIEGRLEKDSDGNLVVVSSDGTETLIEGGLSGKTAAELGVKKVVGEATVELKDEHTEPIQENKITYNPETSEVGIYGKQYTYEGVNVDENGNTVSLRVKDANGKIKTIRNPEAIAEIEFQKELAEIENASGITVEEITREAQENGIEPKDEATKTREGGAEEVQQTGSGEIAEKPKSQTPAIEEPVLEVGVKPAAETGSGVPPAPPVVNGAAGGGVPPLNPPTIEPVNQGGGTPPPTTNTSSGGGGTPPPTVPPTNTETTGGGPLRRRSTIETWARENNRVSKALTKVLDTAGSYYRRQKQSELYQRAMNLLTGGKETKGESGVSTWDWEDGKQSPFDMIDKVAEGRTRNIDEFADVLAQRQVLMKLVTDSMDSVVKELKTETDPTKIKDLENILSQFDSASQKLAKALNEQGTIGGQGISFLGHFRNMYENPEGMIWNEIAKFNENRKKEVANKTKEIASEINDGREQLVKETSDAVANSPEVTEASGKAAKSNTKAKGASSKDSIAKAKDSIAKSREALSKNINSSGKALGLGLVGATLVSAKIGAVAAYHVTKIGVELAKIGAIRFADWVSQLRENTKGIVELSDEELKDLWNTGKVDGASPKEIAQIELRKAAIAPEKKAAREMTLRQKIQGEFKKGKDNLESRLMKEAGLTAEEAKFVMKEGEAVIEESAKKLDAKRVEKEQLAIATEQERIQKEAAKQVAQAKTAAKKELGQRVNKAITDYYKDPTGKTIEERLAENGLDPTQIQEVMDARSTEFAQGAVDAITKAAKEPLPKTKAGEPTIRQKIQNAFNDHFNPKNVGSGVTLKERLTKDVGLTEAQADTVLREENQQLSKREQAMVDEVLRREAEAAQRDLEKAEQQEQQQIKNNVREAINEQFGKDTLKNKVEEKMMADAGIPPKSADKIQIKAGPTKPTVGSKIVENGLDYEYVGESADGKILNYERIKSPEEIEKTKAVQAMAKKAATFGKMKLIDGKNMSKETLAAKIGAATGLEGQELADLVDFIDKENNKTFVDRIEEKTGLPRADAERIAQEATKDFEERAKQHVEAKVKGLKKKPKRESVHRATTDVDRAMNALMDGELTDDMVNDIFSDRLGFMEQMTPEQASRMRDLAKALSETDPGSILELRAAREMDRAFDEFLPSISALGKAGELWKSWAYANMLNGMTTSAVNIISAAPYIALAPALNTLNFSEWVMAGRNAAQAQGGLKTKANVFARSSPVTAAVVKYTAGGKAIKQAARRASDIFLEGYIDNKFLSMGQQAFGKQMNILERSAYHDNPMFAFKGKGLKGLIKAGNYVDAYSWLLKFSGRNLAAQDVFLRTVAHEMMLADAVRKADVFITRGDMSKLGFTKNDMKAAGYSVPQMRNLTYTQWVNFEMSMNNPRFKNVKEMAIADVKRHEELTGGLTEMQRRRFTNTRAKEIMRFGGTNPETGEVIQGLRLSEKAKEDAEAVARSQIFTHQRGGVYSKWSGVLANFVGTKAKILWPLIPFTTIIGNLSDTMADFNPLTGIARANGVSTSELISQFQRYNREKAGNKKPVLSAKMGDANPYGLFTSERINNVVRENKDAKYYEQMARYWTGVQGFVALSMMVNPNPRGEGLGLTGAQDQDKYMITWDGNPVWSYKDLPFIAPAATLVASWHQWNRDKPEKKDQSWYDEGGARLWYALGEAETIASKVSVAEGSMRAMDLVSEIGDVFRESKPGEETPDFGEKMMRIGGKVAKPYLSALTKPLPQRASFVEQIEQAFDPSVYSKSDMINSLTYAFTGAAYKLPGIEKVKMVDIYGDEVEKFPGEDRMAFLKSYKADIADRPWVKFINERGIVFAPTQNRAVAWEDSNDILGVSYKEYTPEQFAYFTKKAGEYFKLALTGGSDPEDGSVVEGIMQYPSDVLKEMDETIVPSGEKRMTQTEKEVRAALSNARSRAREDVKVKFGSSNSSPMMEGNYEGIGM